MTGVRALTPLSFVVIAGHPAVPGGGRGRGAARTSGAVPAAYVTRHAGASATEEAIVAYVGSRLAQ
ncbi:hypothetical protein [Amycolatopsis sp. FDAARGOS 1241]|uniref:hypothetical protein n=1 Tax=Amycolatopsis sp. FDAARGOS 1241 TaxID=2778070 RepID=UPI0019520D29|nr:hypothetical protein [Amycolatopsis sp. FDAARGOS 1241]QRP46420.1 hypothetical protein I6J71_46730 [Amycolatopsis sp. FDAARGOS 1241]